MRNIAWKALEKGVSKENSDKRIKIGVKMDG